MKDERRGIEELRDAVETVARDLESRRVVPTTGPRRRPLMAMAAGFLLVALGFSVWYLVGLDSRTPQEVVVVEMKVRGRVVRSAVVEDAGTMTILVMPRSDQDNGARPPVASLSMGALQ